MRNIIYSVAMSLDGYISGPNGENDWIIIDPDINFESLMGRFDTYLMGRKTFEVTGNGGTMPGSRIVVVSRTLRQEDSPNIKIISNNLKKEITELREESGKEIWLFGGGSLFRSLLDLGLVDGIEVSIIPILLGAGTPLLLPSEDRAQLKLMGSHVYDKTGTVTLEYVIDKSA